MGWLHPLAAVSSAAMDVRVHVCVSVPCAILGDTPGAGMLGPTGARAQLGEEPPSALRQPLPAAVPSPNTLCHFLCIDLVLIWPTLSWVLDTLTSR